MSTVLVSLRLDKAVKTSLPNPSDTIYSPFQITGEAAN